MAYPQLSGRRTVLRTRASEVELSFPPSHPKYGDGSGGSWLQFPKRDEVTFDGASFTITRPAEWRDAGPFCTVTVIPATEHVRFQQAMGRFLPFGTVDQDIAQMGELADACRGHITGANVIVESSADGHRYEVTGIRWEPTIEHPEGRLILVTSDCVHWSEDCDKRVVAANEEAAP